ncbi:uncharacterized protein TNCV_4120481 [Trichonephila clavipes]|nr:uncharacterized protein TNCV_4120481 [Trichonephila clavipes]
MVKPILIEFYKWMEDHIGIFTEEQKECIKFCFKVDGKVDRVKTADLLIHLEELDVQRRFVLACQYWSSWKSHLLDDLTEEERHTVLDHMFVESSSLRVDHLCLSRMSADHRVDVLKRYPLLVLNYYLGIGKQSFFIDAANKVWDRLPEKHFLCLLHLIICHKILLLIIDFDYVNLLRGFWISSPDNFKQYVEKTDIFEILMKILKNGFFPNRATRNFLLHDSSSSLNNKYSCWDKIREILRYQ